MCRAVRATDFGGSGLKSVLRGENMRSTPTPGIKHRVRRAELGGTNVVASRVAK